MHRKWKRSSATASEDKSRNVSQSKNHSSSSLSLDSIQSGSPSKKRSNVLGADKRKMVYYISSLDWFETQHFKMVRTVVEMIRSGYHLTRSTSTWIIASTRKTTRLRSVFLVCRSSVFLMNTSVKRINLKSFTCN